MGRKRRPHRIAVKFTAQEYEDVKKLAYIFARDEKTGKVKLSEFIRHCIAVAPMKMLSIIEPKKKGRP